MSTFPHAFRQIIVCKKPWGLQARYYTGRTKSDRLTNPPFTKFKTSLEFKYVEQIPVVLYSYFRMPDIRDRESVGGDARYKSPSKTPALGKVTNASDDTE